MNGENNDTSNDVDAIPIIESGLWPTTTQTLLDGLWRGDKADWDKFWERYERPISTFIKYKFFSENSKEVSESFVREYLTDAHLRILREAKNYNANKGKFRTFLRTLVRNEICNILDRAARIRSHEIMVDGCSDDEEETGANVIDIYPDTAHDPGEKPEETELWNLAVAIEVLMYVVRRFQWSDLDRQIIAQLIENYKHGDAGHGIVKKIANKLKCSNSQVSTTRTRLHEHYQRVLKSYKDEDLMLQGATAFDKSLEKAVLFRYSNLMRSWGVAR